MELAANGDLDARGALLSRHRDRLRRTVTLHLDPRIRQRVDASDVLQEAAFDALKRFDDYIQNPTMPFFLWLRFLALQRLQEAHRKHLGAERRDVRREVKAGPYLGSEPSSADLAAQFVDGHTTPSQAASRREMQKGIQEVLEKMDPMDREVVVLRHFEQLKNVEVAQCLGIETSAAAKRYLRAMKRLRVVLETMSDFSES